MTASPLCRPRVLCALTALSVTLAAATYTVAGKEGHGNAGVVPPNAMFRGGTYGDWEAGFWQATLATPVVDGDHPFFSGGVVPGDKKVAYLPAPFGEDVHVAVTVPPGTALFIPIFNAECSEIEEFPFHGEDEAEMRACANEWVDYSWGHYAVVDGMPVENIDACRSESPLFEFGPLPADNVYGFPAGTTSLAVSAGYYVLLAPLSVGEHEVQIGAAVTREEFELDFSYNTTFHITVAP